jgi:hypothetical protein
MVAVAKRNPFAAAGETNFAGGGFDRNTLDCDIGNSRDVAHRSAMDIEGEAWPRWRIKMRIAGAAARTLDGERQN